MNFKNALVATISASFIVLSGTAVYPAADSAKNAKTGGCGCGSSTGCSVTNDAKPASASTPAKLRAITMPSTKAVSLAACGSARSGCGSSKTAPGSRPAKATSSTCGSGSTGCGSVGHKGQTGQLNLTDGQKTKIAEINSRYKPRSIALRSELAQKRTELSKLTDDSNASEEAIRGKVRELSDVQRELQLLSILERREKNRIYTPEQKTILASARSNNGSAGRSSASAAAR